VLVRGVVIVIEVLCGDTGLDAEKGEFTENPLMPEMSDKCKLWFAGIVGVGGATQEEEGRGDGAVWVVE
jgi:hypothetical protein